MKTSFHRGVENAGLYRGERGPRVAETLPGSPHGPPSLPGGIQTGSHSHFSEAKKILKKNHFLKIGHGFSRQKLIPNPRAAPIDKLPQSLTFVCSALLFQQCDCVKSGRKMKECLQAKEVPPECLNLATLMFECKRALLDNRQRFREKKGY